jgi:peptidoglycan/LPS O-acetylase OafA/YrhL
MNTTILSLLRFLAAIIVILFHFRGNSEFLKIAPKILTAGPQMVTFFFVLSGFSLVLAYYDKTVFSYKEYWIKRATRIIPIYLLAMVLMVMFMIRYRVELSPVALILHCSFLQSWFPPYPLSINYPAWAMSDLFFFYATFPLILSYIKISRPNPKMFLLLALLLWLFTQVILMILLNTSFYRGYPSSSHDLIYYFPPVHYCSFLLGVATGYLTIKEKKGDLPKIKSILLILIACFLLILFIESQSYITQAIKLQLPFDASFYAPLFMLVIFSFSTSKGLFANRLTSKLIVILGEISFSIYILQVPVGFVTNFILNHYINNIHFFSYDFWLFIHISLLIIIGVFLKFTVEKPIKAAIKKYV